MKATKNILQAYIDNSPLLPAMSSIVTEAIRNQPKNLEENEECYIIFKNYLVNFWERNYGLPQMLIPIVMISQDIFIEVFKLLDDYFPIRKFTQTDDENEEDITSNVFLGRLPRNEIKTFWGKVTINSTINIVKAIFICRYLEICGNLSKDEILFLIQYITSFVDKAQEERVQFFFLAAAPYFARALSLISEHYAVQITQDFFNRIGSLIAMSNTQVILFFAFFSEIKIAKNDYQSKNLETVIETISKFIKKKNPSSECIEYMFTCLTNCFGQILDYCPPLCNSDFIYKTNKL